jgi:hypothetical protein
VNNYTRQTENFMGSVGPQGAAKQLQKLWMLHLLEVLIYIWLYKYTYNKHFLQAANLKSVTNTTYILFQTVFTKFLGFVALPYQICKAVIVYQN